MSAQQVDAALRRLQLRWIAGTATAPPLADVPEAWVPLLETTRPELALLAIAGQCQAFLQVPKAPALRAVDALPVPARPLLAGSLRPLFRAAIAEAPGHLLPALLRLLDARGVMAHPFDWRPSGNADGLPDAYLPWIGAAGQSDASLLEDWDTLGPIQRRQLWLQLRAHDPQAARDCLVARLAALSAEHRLPLVEALAHGLSAQDQPLLQQLLTDRSEKVRRVAEALLARLGQAAPLSEAQRQEIASLLQLRQQGLLRRRRVVALQPSKNRSQREARDALLARAGWGEIAALLQLTSAELAEALELDGGEDINGLLRSALDSADDAAVGILAGRLWLSDGDTSTAHAALLLAPRLQPAQRRTLVLRGIAECSTPYPFDTLLEMAGGPVELGAQALLRSPSWRATWEGMDAQALNYLQLQALVALGCLLPAASAAVVLATLTSPPLGLRGNEPALQVLRLNAAFTTIEHHQGTSP